MRGWIGALAATLGLALAGPSLAGALKGECPDGYVVKAGPYSVYHSGDTVIYNGLVESLTRQQSRSRSCRSMDGGGAYQAI